MDIRWSPEAAVDLAGIVEYIRTQNPSAADRIARTIYDSVASLKSFPNADAPAGSRALANWFSLLYLSLSSIASSRTS